MANLSKKSRGNYFRSKLSNKSRLVRKVYVASIDVSVTCTVDKKQISKERLRKYIPQALAFTQNIF